MGALDGKSAIVTGSARGIGRATAELLSQQGAQVLINDLDGDVAEQASNGDRGRDRGVQRRPDPGRRPGQAGRRGDRRLRQDRHHREQRGLHDRRPAAQDVRPPVPGHAGHPQRRALQGAAGGRSAPARAGQEGDGAGHRVLPQGRERVLDLRARSATPGRPTTRPASRAWWA
ncbi:MAG: SDR family NAD(P)-dependent oxidoreductase [Thermoleophilaceae bacterium]